MAEKPEIVVFTRTMDGLVRIGPTPPPGVPLDFATIDTFEVTGPHFIHEGQQLAPVLDGAEWRAHREKIGFKFQQTNSETKDAIHPLARGLDPTASYTADQIAHRLNKPEAAVAQWWRNWHNGREPRLNSRLETGKGAPRVSSAYDLVVFLERYGDHIGVAMRQQ